MIHQPKPLTAIVNYTPHGGGFGSIVLQPHDTIADGEREIAETVIKAKAEGTNVVVRFVAMATGHCVSQWIVK